MKRKITLQAVLFISIQLLFIHQTSFGQKMLKGIVYQDGKPAAGVTITAHKSSSSILTGFEGKFEIEISEKSKWVKAVLPSGEEQKIELTDLNSELKISFGDASAAQEEKQESKGNSANADTQFGTNPTACKRNLSLYKDNINGKRYKEAVEPWHKTCELCPKVTKNLYIDGVKIYHNLIENSTDNREQYIDELLKVYDARIKYYGQEGFVLGRKGVDLLKYRLEQVDQSYDMLKKSIDLRKAKSEDAVLASFMQATVGMFKLKNIEAETVLSNFQLVSTSLESKIKNAKDQKSKDRAQKALTGVEDLFAGSGAANCEAIVNTFKPKYEANPDDIDLLKKISGMLAKECQEEELFAVTAEKLHKLEPSGASAYQLSILFFKRKEYDKAESYMKEAIKMVAEESVKADYYYELAQIYFQSEKYPQARGAALEAVKLKPKWGQPYILIGLLYVSSSKICENENTLDANAVFWLAIDKFVKAKSIDADCNADATKYINEYSKFFPDKEKAFFLGIIEGQTYKVGCWINESTKVRFNQ